MRRDPGKRWQDFVTALGFLTLIYASARLNLWVTQHLKHSIDAQLWRTDIAFHIDPFAVVYFMQAHAALWYFMEMFYVALAIVMAMAWLTEQNRTLRRAVAIAGVGGWIFSAAFPAVGPLWYLDGYTVTMRHCFSGSGMELGASAGAEFAFALASSALDLYGPIGHRIDSVGRALSV